MDPGSQRGLRGMRAFLLLQVPDMLLAGLVLVLLHWWAGLPREWALGLFAIWVLKDVGTYLLLRNIFFMPPRIGPETLAGTRAIAQERLAPCGHVRLAGEIWRAESLRPGEEVPPGTLVVVRATRGLTLLVEPEGPIQYPHGED